MQDVCLRMSELAECLFLLFHFQHFNTFLVEGLSSPDAFCAVQDFSESMIY